MIKPFSIAIPQADIDDLKRRLSYTRWPDEVKDAEWNMGVNLRYLKGLADYWQNIYNWRAQEAKLNKLPQFIGSASSLDIHFVHTKSNNPNATPLLLVHGWPDNFYRFHKIIPLLSDSFNIVIPSIPGFGFSERKTITSNEVADIFARLMVETLGYKHFVASGCDIGSNIVRALALKHSDSVMAIHLTNCYPTGNEDLSTLTEAEKQLINKTQIWMKSEGAYLMVQATKPQTIAYLLNDSPIGLAAWIVSMIKSQAEGDKIDEAFGGRDELLTNIMIYWFTRIAGSAASIYYLDTQERYTQKDSNQRTTRSRVPAGITLFPRDLQFPKEWAERTVNVQYYEKIPRGGHFAALEEPQLFVGSLRNFFTNY